MHIEIFVWLAFFLRKRQIWGDGREGGRDRKKVGHKTDMRGWTAGGRWDECRRAGDSYRALE
jgi:hypothetical protein